MPRPRQPQPKRPARRPATRQRGFTLIEVLVALAIIAVAMSAAIRVAGLMTQSNGLLRDRSIALLAAQSRLAELRLEGRLPPGTKNIECDQGRLKLRCEQNIAPSPDPRLSRVSVLVLDRSREAPPLARLDTLVARVPKNPNR
ncbi:type II secretion system minor pseudopilin GspI [Pseudomonas chlororaphis]|uniref:type II secretion system minor pseudopilin GspI n=1 Tax=Pseudomonas chlororaphis TaxID=587753 RepID=UPI0007B36D58|nr:type II secretion system minor pseudopilin GspI [Pseudomonas chlororaphis]KZO49618.1 general secretion pathway protein I [Pseudomonas chlororaphis subsp. piscium]MBP5071811.1 type II secretion system minor pseudopilin GspI [Pseudomonas chlororaphis]